MSKLCVAYLPDCVNGVRATLHSLGFRGVSAFSDGGINSKKPFVAVNRCLMLAMKYCEFGSGVYCILSCV